MHRAFFLALLGLFACASPLAQLNIEDVRLTNEIPGDKHLTVEVDVRAAESGGSNVGVYCVTVKFDGQTDVQRVCNTDLTDGDTRTVRIVSETAINTGAVININAILANYIDSEVRNAP